MDFYPLVEFFEFVEVRCKLTLGKLHCKKHKPIKNYSRAIKYFEYCAQQDNSTAMYKMGKMYYEGRGVSQNYIRAANWFRRAAKKGHTKAIAHLGFMYYYGLGVRKNCKKAEEYTEIAADRGLLRAKLLLATIKEKDQEDKEWGSPFLDPCWFRSFEIADMGNTYSFEEETSEDNTLYI